MRAYLRVLRDHPDFARLWGANVISLLGDWFNTIVLAALVVRFSPGQEGTAVSLFLLARFVPPMLLSPFAGVLIDRLNRKKLLIWSNVLRSVVVFGFLFVLNDPSLLPLVYLLTAAQFTLSTVFEPGQAALIPNIVPYQDLLRANTLFNITWSVMLALGAAAGGVIAALFGPSIALGVNVVTFLLSALRARGPDPVRAP
jgi:MFS family permease